MSIHDINWCWLQACSLCPTWSWRGATSTCSRTRWRRRWTRTASATRWQLAHRQRCYQGCYQGCLQVTIHKVLEHQQLPSETTFGCEIEIPGTDYFVRYILNGFNQGDREKARVFETLNFCEKGWHKEQLTITIVGKQMGLKFFSILFYNIYFRCKNSVL